MPSLRQPHAEQARFLVRMNGVVLLPARLPQRRDRQERVEHHLGPRGTDPHAADAWRTRRSNDPQVRQVDVGADGIRHQIDMVAELGECLDSMVFAEWRAPRLEERLGGEHQDAQRARTGRLLTGRIGQGQ